MAKHIKVTHQTGKRLDTPREKTRTSMNLNEERAGAFIKTIPLGNLDGLALACRTKARELKVKAGGGLNSKGAGGTGSVLNLVRFVEGVNKDSSKEEKALFKKLFSSVAARYDAAGQKYPKPLGESEAAKAADKAKG